MDLAGRKLSSSRGVSHLAHLSFLESNVHQQLFPFDVDHVAERAVAMAGKIQAYAAVADLQIADVQIIQPPRQRGTHHVQLFALRAGTNSQD